MIEEFIGEREPPVCQQIFRKLASKNLLFSLRGLLNKSLEP